MLDDVDALLEMSSESWSQRESRGEPEGVKKTSWSLSELELREMGGGGGRGAEDLRALCLGFRDRVSSPGFAGLGRVGEKVSSWDAFMGRREGRRGFGR